MEKKIYKTMEEWADSLNEWERLFWSYLVYADFRIEPNENISEDFPNKYWIVDNQLVWDSEPCNSVVDVFESHPTIVDEIIDDLDEEIATLNVPEKFTGEDKQTYYYWEAGFWALLLDNAASLGLEEWVKDHDWALKICKLVAFHSEDVDLEKFI